MKFRRSWPTKTSDVVAFYDINPQAPLHVLIIPRKHIAMINDIQPEDAALGGEADSGGAKRLRQMLATQRMATVR